MPLGPPRDSLESLSLVGPGFPSSFPRALLRVLRGPWKAPCFFVVIDGAGAPSRPCPPRPTQEALGSPRDSLESFEPCVLGFPVGFCGRSWAS